MLLVGDMQHWQRGPCQSVLGLWTLSGKYPCWVAGRPFGVGAREGEAKLGGEGGTRWGLSPEGMGTAADTAAKSYIPSRAMETNTGLLNSLPVLEIHWVQWTLLLSTILLFPYPKETSGSFPSPTGYSGSHFGTLNRTAPGNHKIGLPIAVLTNSYLYYSWDLMYSSIEGNYSCVIMHYCMNQ